MKRLLAILGMLTVAGCAGPDPNPLAWTATYARPFDALTYCLNANATDYQTVLGLDAQRGIGGVELIDRIRDRVPRDRDTVEELTLVPHRASVMSSTRRTLTPARYISTSASSTEDCLRR